MVSTATYRAIQIDNRDDEYTTSLKNLPITALPEEGDVEVEIAFSSLNYKDALAITGTSPIIKEFPLTPGIDFAGTILKSDNANFHKGDQVILTGYGVGERHSGGFAELARVNGEWIIPLPSSLTAKQSMAIGTAGLTAMLCIMALEKNGVKPEEGPVLVTGANGGVGSFSVMLLNELGYEVHAATGRPELSDHLQKLGASKIIPREDLNGKGRPLRRETWAGAIDSVGSSTLANVLASMKYGGTVAACGLAQGYDLPATVMPFILRGVSLAGVDSVMAPNPLRVKAWERITTLINHESLNDLSQVLPLSDIFRLSKSLLSGDIRGRVVIDVQN